MDISEEKRVETFRKASEPIRNLYGDDLLTEKIGELHSKYSVTVERKILSNCVGDIILGFYKIAELPQLLQTNVGVTPEVAQKITADLIEFLDPVVQREVAAAQASKEQAEAEAVAKKESVNILAEKIKAIPPIQPKPPSETPPGKPQSKEPSATNAGSMSEANSELETIPPLRTMQTDMQRIHGYGALPQYQEPEDQPVIQATSQDDIRKPDQK